MYLHIGHTAAIELAATILYTMFQKELYIFLRVYTVIHLFTSNKTTHVLITLKK
jgi:hypothetical protein